MNRLDFCFIANATVLCTHQIDAAYWHEWEMFHLPGGNQLNLILNLPILASVFVACWLVASRSRQAKNAHIYLAALGGLTVTIHSGFFLFGYEQFLQSMSLVLMGATALLSTAQIFLLRRA